MTETIYQISYPGLLGWPIFDRRPARRSLGTGGEERVKKLKYHIQTGDYFGTLATVLDLMNQTSEKTNKKVQEIKEDLLLLQKNYKIVRKIKNPK